jgi:ribosomal protein L11 methyltransferase
LSPAGRHITRTSAHPALAHIQKKIHRQVIGSRRRLTFSDLERQVAHQENCPRADVRAAIRGLIEQGILEYRYTFGQSYIAMSFRNPVDVSAQFTIVPPDYTGNLPTHPYRIAIAPGVSFGSGRHPTTRLALQVLEEGWLYLGSNGLSFAPSVMDIGTGSGILAIAASCLGAALVMALDVDACARSEARLNIDLNPKAADVVVVSDTPLASIEKRFDMVIANLRLPTLIQISGWIQAHLQCDGCVVVSGFREEEWDRLLACYADQGFHSMGHHSMAGWSAGLFGLVDAKSPKV